MNKHIPSNPDARAAEAAQRAGRMVTLAEAQAPVVARASIADVRAHLEVALGYLARAEWRLRASDQLELVGAAIIASAAVEAVRREVVRVMEATP